MKKPRRGNPIWSISKGHATHTIREVRNAILTTKRRSGDPLVVLDDSKEYDGPPSFQAKMITLKKTMVCTACGKSVDCARISGLGVKYSEVWVCKKCFKTERQQRRNYNQRHGLFQGNPNRLLTHPWPKQRSRVETRIYVEP